MVISDTSVSRFKLKQTSFEEHSLAVNELFGRNMYVFKVYVNWMVQWLPLSHHSPQWGWNLAANWGAVCLSSPCACVSFIWVLQFLPKDIQIGSNCYSKLLTRLFVPVLVVDLWPAHGVPCLLPNFRSDYLQLLHDPYQVSGTDNE